MPRVHVAVGVNRRFSLLSSVTVFKNQINNLYKKLVFVLENLRLNVFQECAISHCH
jgi:hypothetical protein